MKSFVSFFLTTLLLFWGNAHALPNRSVKTKSVKPSSNSEPKVAADESRFLIDPNIVEKVYQANHMEQSRLLNEKTPAFDLRLGGLFLSKLDMVGSYFKVNTEDSSRVLPNFEIGISKEIWKGILSSTLRGHAGYSFRQGNFRVKSSEGLESDDNLTIQWLPAGLSVRTAVPSLEGPLSPGLDVGVGYLGYFQSGSLDGISQTAWIPYGHIGIDTKWVRGNGSSGSFFDSLTFSLNFLNDLTQDRDFQAWMFQIGTELNL